MRRFGLGLALVTVFTTALVVNGCGGEQPAPTTPTPAFSGCRIHVPESQEKPFVVAWESAMRGTLERRLHEGVIIVHYEDCGMELLERCTTPTKYRWTPTPTPKRDRLSISTIEQLWANMPLGATRFEDVLSAGDLTIEALRVGTWTAAERVDPATLKGVDCARATHVVSSIAAGAFEMGIRAHSQKAEFSQLAHEGQFETCAAQGSEERPPEHCAASIRIEITKIGAVSRTCRPNDREDCALQCKNDSEISCQRLATILVNVDDNVAAASLFRRGCDRDDQRACNNLGVMLVRGVGVAHDLPRARTLFARACDAGIAEACANSGLGLSRDEYSNPTHEPNADAKFRQACTLHVGLGCYEAAMRATDDGHGVPDAIGLLGKGCEFGHGPACAKLAVSTRPTNRAGADKLDERACSLGFRSSCPNGAAVAAPDPKRDFILLPAL